MGTSWPVTQRIHIDTLPGECRRRLVDAIGGTGRDVVGQLAPILSSRLGIVRLAVVASVGVFAAAAAVTAVWEATPMGPPAAGSRGAMALMAVALAVAGALVAALVRRVVRICQSPIWPGVYVVQSDLVDARGPVLAVTSVASTRVDAVHQYLLGSYIGTIITFRAAGASWRFVVRGRRSADARMSALRTALVCFLAALQRRDAAALDRIDPLFAVRMSRPLVAGADPGHTCRR